MAAMTGMMMDMGGVEEGAMGQAELMWAGIGAVGEGMVSMRGAGV